MGGWDRCSAGKMEYLLGHPDTTLELDRQAMVLYSNGTLDPAKLGADLDHLVMIRQRMPEYLFRS